MSRGKSICSVLKTIRKQVADANGIEYEPRECHHQGDCRGTCPACEAEVRYIQQQLDIRRQLGKAVAVVGISAGLAALNSCAFDNESLVIPATSILTEEPEPPFVGDIVEDMPEFPGGSQKLFEYLMENTHYPEIAEKNGVQGRVVVTFIVEKDGSITEAKIVKSVDQSLDEEAVRVVKSMPKWKPGMCNGEPSRVKYTVPITFRLPESNDDTTDRNLSPSTVD
jgi:TonB family protein